MEILITLFYQPLYNALIFLYGLLWNDLGLAIIILTILIKLVLLPMSRKQISSQKEMQEIQPKIKELQQKHKGDREKIARQTMALYKEHGINPAAGCLPLIVTLIFFFTLFTVIRNLSQRQDFVPNESLVYPFVPYVEKINEISAGFLNLGVANPVLAVLTAVAAYYQIRMMQAKLNNQNQEKEQEKKLVEKKVDKADGDDMPDFATVMQKQMLYIIPIMTLVIGFTFPAGLTLYWLTSTLFTIGQQWSVMKGDKKIAAT